MEEVGEIERPAVRVPDDRHLGGNQLHPVDHDLLPEQGPDLELEDECFAFKECPGLEVRLLGKRDAAEQIVDVLEEVAARP